MRRPPEAGVAGLVSTADRLDTAQGTRLARASLIVLFTYVFLANAWLGDDAHITFRVAWNFVHGYGLTFNPDERVQAVTHPLWTLVIAAAYALTREFFFTPLVISWACCLAAGILLVRWAGTTPRAAVAVAWILSSKAFVDYTASGLEYPLSYLLLTLFYTRYLDRPVASAPDPTELRRDVLIASLGFLTRPDAILLYLVPLAEMAFRSLRADRRRAIGAMAAGVMPAVLWLGFSTVYYGFPLPNTFYAKVANGIPRFIVYEQGVAYFLNSIGHDPMTLGTIALSVLMAAAVPGAPRRAAASAVVYVAYTVSVGGDFMSGRFFAMPFLVAVMTIVPGLEWSSAGWALGALVLYNLVVPIVPIKTTASYEAGWPWRTQNGIRDERGHTHQVSNVLFYSPFHELPDHVWVHEGLSFRNGPEKVSVQGSIGGWGLNAGPTKFVVDRNALSDPLLARLPVSPRLYFEFYAGHYFRDIPDGYLESLDRDQNLLQDPLLHEYYDRLRNVTRGSLFRASRFRDMWALNVGRYRNLHDEYEKRRQIALSIPADNERFLTDVGARAPTVLRTTGRAGYLQYGPRIPLKKGYYRARWIGVVENVPGTEIGFVEVWDGPDRRLDRKPVVAAANDKHLITQIDFTLAEDAAAVEYRFFANAAASVRLERVELYSGLAIPAN